MKEYKNVEIEIIPLSDSDIITESDPPILGPEL